MANVMVSTINSIRYTEYFCWQDFSKYVDMDLHSILSYGVNYSIL